MFFSFSYRGQTRIIFNFERDNFLRFAHRNIEPFLSDDTKVEQNYANQNGALKSCPGEQRSDVKKGKWASLLTKGGNIYTWMLDWTTLVCMITETLCTISSLFFSSLSIILRLLLFGTISLKACRIVSYVDKRNSDLR